MRVAAIALLVLTSLLTSEGQAPAQPAPAQPQPKVEVLAEEVYKNIKLFKGKPARRVIPAMEALNGLLGVECTHCHVQYEWEKDVKEPRQNALKMFDMQAYLNREHFEGKNAITCWTCHRGHPEPARMARDPESLAKARELVPLTPEEQDKPAGEVFMNLEVFAQQEARRIPAIMSAFSRALGVECSHCHVPDSWERDDKEPKKTARRMLKVAADANQQLYGGEGSVACFTCHQGKPKPETEPGQPASQARLTHPVQ